jgi:hypothetical protein
MRKLSIVCTIAAASVIAAAPMPVQAAMPGQGGIAATVATISDTIEVKRGWGKHKGWKGRRAGVPPGWSRGRKVGWGSGGMPPGQAKKRWR